jgi:hypothetical protein
MKSVPQRKHKSYSAKAVWLMPFSETIAVYTENHTVRTVHDTFQHSYHLAPGRSCMTQRQMLKDFVDTSHVLLHKYSEINLPTL